MAQTRKLGVIIFADIAGYTALMQSDENKALQFLAHFKETLEREAQVHDGEIVQFYGDGCLLSFDSSTKAVHCAIAMQKGFMDAINVPVRVGIHLGEVVYKEGNVFGDGVNIASRIESAGVPGSILVSQSVRDQIKNKSAFPLKWLGAFHFKNVEEPIPVYAIAREGLVVPKPMDLSGIRKVSQEGRSSYRQRFIWPLALVTSIAITALLYFVFYQEVKEVPTKGGSPSIAVLPLVNLSQDNQRDYLSEGFTAEIVYQLSKIESLSVVSQSSVRELSNQKRTSTEIAQDLGIHYMLEGTIRNVGPRVRLTTNLVRTADQQLIWAGEFDLSEEDLIDAQIEVSMGIAEKLPLSISEEKINQLTEKATSNPLAYEFYLKALDVMPYWVVPVESFDPAINFLQNAITLDEDFTEAHALLAQAYYRSSNMVGAAHEKLLEKALASAHRAIALDKSLPQGYLVLGRIYNDTDPPKGIEWLVKANELDPKIALFELGGYYQMIGDLVNAFEYFSLKIERDPKSELGYIGVGEVYQSVGNFEQAISIFKHLLKQGYTNDRIYGNLANLYMTLGQTKQALNIIDAHIIPRDSLAGIREKAIVLFFEGQWLKAEELYSQMEITGDMDLGFIHLKTGRENSGRILLEAAAQRRQRHKTNHPWPIRDLSRIYAATGDRVKAYKYLEDLMAMGDLHYSWFDIDPFFNDIRLEPAFKKIAAERASKLRALRIKIPKIEWESI